jgi:PadR family transcriptional regulator, regulatory protein AphA
MSTKNQKTRWVILGLLAIEPLSGYDIKKLIATSVGHFWSESNGQLYPTLNHLVHEQLIVFEEVHQKGKKQRHIYSITDKGRTELEMWLKTTTEQKNNHRDEELLKLFFAKNVPTSSAVQLLQNREQLIRLKLEQYLVIKKEIEHHKDSPHYTYWSLTLKNGICHAMTEIEWCTESIKTLSQKD